MLKKYTLIISFIGSSYLISMPIDNPTMLTIPVQFPTTLKAIPPIYMYYCGSPIKPDDYNTRNKLLFSFLENRMRTRFWLVVTDTMPKLEMLIDNTVDYLKIDSSRNYKFYALTLMAKEIANTEKIEYVWNVQEGPIPAKNGRLPDDTLILNYNADFVDRLEGGNAIELPTIVIKQDIVKLAGSEKSLDLLHEQSIMTAIDYNAIHAPLEQEVCYHSDPKTIITITT